MKNLPVKSAIEDAPVYVLMDIDNAYFFIILFGVVLTTEYIQDAAKYKKVQTAFTDQQLLLDNFKKRFSIHSVIV